MHSIWSAHPVTFYEWYSVCILDITHACYIPRPSDLVCGWLRGRTIKLSTYCLKSVSCFEHKDLPNTSPCSMSYRVQVFIRSVFLFLKHNLCYRTKPLLSVCLSVCLCKVNSSKTKLSCQNVTLNDAKILHKSARSVAAILKNWIFFSSKNNTLKLYVRLKGSSPGGKCLFTLRSGLSAHGTTKDLSSPLSVASQNAMNRMPPAGGPTLSAYKVTSVASTQICPCI